GRRTGRRTEGVVRFRRAGHGRGNDRLRRARVRNFLIGLSRARVRPRVRCFISSSSEMGGGGKIQAGNPARIPGGAGRIWSASQKISELIEKIIFEPAI